MSTETTAAKNSTNSALVRMAERYGMDPAAFHRTIVATVMPPSKDGAPSVEQVSAFLLVADHYELNPLTKEIYAFPAKGGGITPIVGYDGWVRLMNSHPQADGIDLKDNHDASGRLVSCTARVHRKDRSHPVEVTEHLAECIRSTEPWSKWPSRMLRNKATIQAIRLAFGFAGIYDPDEAERMAEVVDVRARVVEQTTANLAQLTARLEQTPAAPAAPVESAPVAEPLKF